MKIKETISVWFSCGAASAVAAKLTIDKYEKTHNILVVPTYWNLVRKTFPEVFNQRAEQSRLIGCKLARRKGKRIFLDELLETDKGGKIKNYECGIFCDTK